MLQDKENEWSFDGFLTTGLKIAVFIILCKIVIGGIRVNIIVTWMFRMPALVTFIDIGTDVSINWKSGANFPHYLRALRKHTFMTPLDGRDSHRGWRSCSPAEKRDEWSENGFGKKESPSPPFSFLPPTFCLCLGRKPVNRLKDGGIFIFHNFIVTLRCFP